MNLQPAKSRRTPTSVVVVPDDLIAEILSFLQFRCVIKYQEYWFRLWNLASRQLSPKFGYFHTVRCRGNYIFNFGCDNSSDTYKVLAFREKLNQPKSSVRILSLSDDVVWRGIESFPALPLCLANGGCSTNGVYCSGTFNWLAIHDDINGYSFEDITVEQLVIFSLDLGTETYRQYKLPCGFDELPPAAPIMKKYGAEDSWTQFLKISYQHLQVDYDLAPSFQLLPVLLFEDADTLLLRSRQENEAILYNWSDNKVRRTNITASKAIPIIIELAIK
ncbi:hypothetical protein MTR_4g128320 [Medicago truncatula]|uniref:F-box protein interaction domain protein n=1 Tax=Medicago truncatula TaxID=3880 RepID=G7JVH6_MEDTR|nr:hypothetical protein MTR_4g128320 [Medicago truncatula]